ncbi:hypothetical protein ACFSCX_19040 [Bacillus salitolerans]|uniref:DUF4306 domain-containing protein n=1 Tax=Bacillus salitolerans TaxID=1437434 RepID=A0ABW4LU28_9BACI
MNKISRWMIVCVLILFGVLLLNKGLDLRSLGTSVDGDGIGVYFLGFEINERVPEESIPSYAVGFFISSFLVIIASLTFVGMNLKSGKKES